ncbi:hypothetical protein ACQ1ZS_15135, partial [Enterococcus faecalis]|uniref:hypothetical protein n=1 Tax=Enterococcus faecalis TaxID=1351 RepID=UPI003D6BE1E7
QQGDGPLFCRSTTPPKNVELRGLCPADLAQALDALAFAEGMNRNDYIVAFLDKHVKVEAHKTMVRHRMLRGNPYLPETD